MTRRAGLIDGFLRRESWDGALREGIAGDASARAYSRLKRPGGATAILMDCLSDPVSIGPFLSVGAFLARQGFSTPTIFATDEANGLVLLEDFGDDVFARLMDASPDQQEPLYRAAVDMLAQLARVSVPTDLTRFTPPHMATMVDPVFDWYLKGMDCPAEPAKIEAFRDTLESELARSCSQGAVVSLRDCHAENLMWLPDRDGVRKVGLLDFQDAVVTHPAYDLVSLLQDARRDMPQPLADDMIARFLATTGSDKDDFHTAFAVLGVQRNLRILGIFSRLAMKDGKIRYLAFMKRVWTHLEQNMAHPSLHLLESQIRSLIPEPTEIALQRMADYART